MPKRIKNTIERLEELKDAILLLKDALDKINQNERAYYKVLSGQLRALLSDTSENIPLLINLADTLGVNLICYSVRSNEEEMTLGLPQPTLRLNRRIIDINPFQPTGFFQYNLKDWLQKTFTIINNQPLKVIDIIRTHSDKKGGAHYDLSIPESKVFLETIQYKSDSNIIDEIEKYLIQIAQVTIHFGYLIINMNK
ncbi:hypothetical protein A2335_02545 [Candidatus Peregrinibacteria bacterium RIFOXYB2_FULL_32_7]|nr:MAG: hypothetical protein A2335_02545 [Candidatus Peregrinibacteria bacterium RIFOXYB2_FULL_32_7]